MKKLPKLYCSFPRLYKNKVEEEPGWNEQVLKWCQEAAQAGRDYKNLTTGVDSSLTK